MVMLAGVTSAIVSAAIWAAITVETQHQIGWMAVGVGFFVGFSVRNLGKGISNLFGIVGAVCALVGCGLGNLLSACGFLSIEVAEPFFRVASTVLTQPAAAKELLIATSTPTDFLFYGLAVYEGYKFSFRRFSQEDLVGLVDRQETE